MNDMEAAREWYRVGASLAQRPDWVSTEWSYNHRFYLKLDAASIASDMAVAETYAGRNPRGALSREIPL